MTYDSPTRLIEWLIDRIAERGTRDEQHGGQAPRGRLGAGYRGSAFPVHPDRQLWLPVQLPHGRARGPGRHGRLAVRPPFDSPSVFGALLGRGAGGFRFAPFGINVPSDRIYEPGTNTLVTSWKTPTGWVVVATR